MIGSGRRNNKEVPAGISSKSQHTRKELSPTFQRHIFLRKKVRSRKVMWKCATEIGQLSLDSLIGGLLFIDFSDAI